MITRADASAVKGFFAGSGLDAFSDAAVVDRVLMLTGLFDAERKVLTAPVRVAYIGTAVYDIPKYRDRQTKCFLSRGCTVGEVCVADVSTPNKVNNNNNNNNVDNEDLEFLGRAHVILVSGGNTLFAVRRWEETGLDTCLRAAAIRGAVLAGGSAGAICWFASGHSDSADPATYASAMLRAEYGQLPAEKEKGDNNNNGNNKREEEGEKTWSYIRVHGLGLLPGLVCPHYDMCESNGVLRAEDFDKMMRRHPTERGIGIDHWAALVLLGDGTYEIFATPGKGRGATTTTNNNKKKNNAGATPAVYVKDVVNNEVRTVVMSGKGRVSELLREPSGPVVRDPFEAYYAMANPTATTEKLLCRSR